MAATGSIATSTCPTSAPDASNFPSRMSGDPNGVRNNRSSVPSRRSRATTSSVASVPNTMAMSVARVMHTLK